MSTRNKKATWKQEIKEDDIFVDDPQAGDLIIPIMGPTGVGKSTFINILLGREAATVGHDLQSQTAHIHHYVVPDEHRRIVVVDTPGFDDTKIDDREILRRIAVWLAHSYSADMKLAGIIYLHEITQARMLGASRRNFDMFNKLCGPEATGNVILATTKWLDVTEEAGSRREEQLRTNHWNEMIALGSRMRRFDHTQPSAQNIVKDILARNAVDAIQIQSELVLVDKVLAETEAGRTLRYSLMELLEAQKQMAAQIKKDGTGELDTREEVIERDNKIRSLLGQINGLTPPRSRKFMPIRWLGKLRQ